MNLFIPSKKITERIILIREERVMLDMDLAELYGVTTKALNQTAKRNQKRFPIDFMFQLTPEEKKEVVTNCDHLRKLRFSPVLPYAFTEHGAVMLASVLRSERAVQMSVFVVRAFIQLKSVAISYQDILIKLEELEKAVGVHDIQLRSVIQMIRDLIPQIQRKRKIGFYVTTPLRK
jgi:hypothetical protein